MKAPEVRQTDLSIDELIEEMESSERCYPKCFIINEIGSACLCGEDEKGRGKKILLGLLDGSEERYKFPALCLLSLMTNLDKKETLVLQSFRADSDNQHLVELAEKNIEELKAQID